MAEECRTADQDLRKLTAMFDAQEKLAATIKQKQVVKVTKFHMGIRILLGFELEAFMLHCGKRFPYILSTL